MFCVLGACVLCVRCWCLGVLLIDCGFYFCGFVYCIVFVLLLRLLFAVVVLGLGVCRLSLLVCGFDFCCLLLLICGFCECFAS